MNPHETWNDQLREMAEAYAAGRTRDPERAEYEAHLAACELCRHEVEGLETIVSALGLAAPEAEPSDRVWRSLDEKLSTEVQTWKAWTADQPAAGPLGLFLRRGDESDWEPTGVEGVEARRLFSDPASDRVTMLVRMAPGSAYPAHVHAGPEECYVLEGDLQVGDELEMSAGDYQRAEGGSSHPVQSTRGGCLLLLNSSLKDELVA